MTKARTNADNVTADISGITAGTGLSGGGASGAVTLAIDTATTADLSTAQTLTNKTLAAASNTLTGVINNTLTTTTGDIIYASAANTPARLGIGSTDQVLKVSGGIPAWAAAATGALTKITSASFSNVADTGTTFDAVFTSTYKNYLITFFGVYGSVNNATFYFRLRNGGSTLTTAYYGNYVVGVTKTDTNNATQFSVVQIRDGSTQQFAANMTLYRSNNRLSWSYGGAERVSNYSVIGSGFSDHVANDGADGFILSASSGNIYGTVSVYGYEA